MCARAGRQPLQPPRGGALEPALRAEQGARPSTATTTPGSTPTATSYDFMLGVDPDHVPLPNFAERFLGYFRDPDVAFVVGPAGLRQLRGLRRRAPPSRSSSCSTRCSSGPATARARRCWSAPTTRCGVSALRQIGGFQDSITEDMATEPRDARDAQPADRARAGPPSTRPTSWPSGRGRRRSPTTSASRTAGRAAPTRCWSRRFWRRWPAARPARAGPLPAAHLLLPDGRDRLGARRGQRDPLLRARAPAAWSCPRTCG